ncbi:MAG: priA [Rickettsiaceae bacterium]|jgi:primosomal protein N' (replication factor Y)|nr:priA [Rickettsiaceae bacterium]
MHRIAKVLVPNLKLDALSYLIPEGMEINIGDLVKVNLRKKELLGVVVATLPLNENLSYDLKPINEKLYISNIATSYLSFLDKFANYNMVPMGAVWKLALPIEIFLKRKELKPLIQKIDQNGFSLPTLSSEQEASYQNIKNNSGVTLLKGITGSGKTEIYFHLAADALREGKQVLIMLPEIALSTQMINRFKSRFNFEPVVWNSAIKVSQKRNILLGLMRGDVKLVIGSRSSLLLPYKNLSLIIIDEEHDASYKQDEGIVYNARDMAILRGFMEKFPILLCSATPSIETYVNAHDKKYNFVELNSRYGVDSLPEIKAIDLLKEQLEQDRWISPSLKLAITQTLAKNYQVLIFLNRRGYAPLMLCKCCGYRYSCPSCSAWLVYHKSKSRLECHHCGQVSAMKKICPSCREETNWIACGPGVERIADEVELLFPNHRIQVVTKDTIQKPEQAKEILNKIEQHQVDIIIGTQIITKGYHFPSLNLVGVIDGDFGLNGGDLKASERTYQLLNQVSGRAGRVKERGVVYIQTYHPDSIILKALKENDENKFFSYEISSRKATSMPPFARMAAILISGKDESKTLSLAMKIVNLAPINDNLKVLGPAPSLMYKLKNKYRYRILVSCDKKYNLQDVIRRWLDQIKLPSWSSIKIDIDPYSFY